MRSHALCPRALATAGVLTLTALAVALHVVGIGHELPCDRLGDESTFADSLARILRGEPIWLGHGTEFYPQALPLLVGLGGRFAPDAAPATLAEHLAAASAPIVALRAVVAVLSALIVPATYRIARRFLGRPASLLAAGFAATSLLDTWYACQARPHAAFAGLAAVALAAALDVRRRGDRRSWLAAVLACAAAVATLQTGVLLLAPLAVAHFSGSRARREALRPMLAGLAVVLTLWIFLPTAFQGLEVRAGEGGTALGEDGFLPIPLLESLDGSGLAAMLDAALDFDAWLALLAAIGALAAAVRLARARPRVRDLVASRRFRDALVLASFALPLAAVYALYANTADRYLLPLLPFVAIPAASLLRGSTELARRALARSRHAPAAFAAVALLLVPPAATALALVSARASADTGDLAAAWIGAHVERGAERIAVMPSLELPLVRDGQGAAWIESFGDRPQPPWIRYQRALDAATRERLGWPIVPVPVHGDSASLLERDPASYLASTGARWFVIEVWPPARSPFYAHLRRVLGERADLALRVSPWRRGGDERAFRVVDRQALDSLSGHYAWHALRARRMGPVIEVYRLREPPG